MKKIAEERMKRIGISSRNEQQYVNRQLGKKFLVIDIGTRKKVMNYAKVCSQGMEAFVNKSIVHLQRGTSLLNKIFIKDKIIYFIFV